MMDLIGLLITIGVMGYLWWHGRRLARLVDEMEAAQAAEAELVAGLNEQRDRAIELVDKMKVALRAFEERTR